MVRTVIKSLFLRENFRTFDSTEVIENLKESGYAMIEGFASKKTIRELSTEFDFLLSLASYAGTKRNISNGEYGLCPIELIEKNKDKCGKTFEFLTHKNLKKIGEDYLNAQDEKIEINNQIEFEINHSKGRSTASLPHFDRMPALKMFIYLTDVKQKSGATFLFPKTYREVRRHIFSSLSSISDIHELKNFISASKIPKEEFFIECRKGTLVIIDTAGLHGGGNILEDNVTRKVIRGITWYLPASFQHLNTAAIGISDELFAENMGQPSLPTVAFDTFDEINSA